MLKTIIAVVGRPNVGKSTLFNAVIGERVSIVDDHEGVTRDRIYADAEWFGRPFVLVDTGGLDPKSEDVFRQQMRRQAELAVDTADAIIFMVDAKTGLQTDDMEIAQMLRKSGKPILLAANKCDRPGPLPLNCYDFYELGLGEVYGISAVHRMGLGELISAALEAVPEKPEPEHDDSRIHVAIIGKPNAGKSSLLNKILGEERSIVTDIAGTTRDALDVDFEHETGSYTLIDTAGLRKKSRVDDRVEKYSILRTQEAVERADVCLIMIDAAQGISEQDTKVAGLAHQAGKASIFIMNKWDLVEKDGKTMELFKKALKEKLGFMRYAPALFISALTGQRVKELFPLIQHVYAEAGKRLSTGVINEVIAEAIAMHPTPQDKGRQLKIFYATQVASRPPQIVFFVNDKKLMHFSYERYLENQLRNNFSFEGSPLQLIWRDRKKTDFIRSKNDPRRQKATQSEGEESDE